jgi:hypothetical protein
VQARCDPPDGRRRWGRVESPHSTTWPGTPSNIEQDAAARRRCCGDPTIGCSGSAWAASLGWLGRSRGRRGPLWRKADRWAAKGHAYITGTVTCTSR